MWNMMSLHLAGSQQAFDGLDQDDGLGDGATYAVLRALGLASLVLGVTAAGLFAGRELRSRYKFKRRTPSDFYSKAGDPVDLTEYGMGV